MNLSNLEGGKVWRLSSSARTYNYPWRGGKGGGLAPRTVLLKVVILFGEEAKKGGGTTDSFSERNPNLNQQQGQSTFLGQMIHGGGGASAGGKHAVYSPFCVYTTACLSPPSPPPFHLLSSIQVLQYYSIDLFANSIRIPPLVAPSFIFGLPFTPPLFLFALFCPPSSEEIGNQESKKRAGSGGMNNFANAKRAASGGGGLSGYPMLGQQAQARAHAHPGMNLAFNSQMGAQPLPGTMQPAAAKANVQRYLKAARDPQQASPDQKISVLHSKVVQKSYVENCDRPTICKCWAGVLRPPPLSQCSGSRPHALS